MERRNGSEYNMAKYFIKPFKTTVAVLVASQDFTGEHVFDKNEKLAESNLFTLGKERT